MRRQRAEGPAPADDLPGADDAGFTVTEHEDLRGQFEEQVGGWLEDGKVHSLHTVLQGFEAVPEAFASLLTGGSTGRVIVSTDED